MLFIDEIHRLSRGRRGVPLPGDGGLPARHRRRQGPGGLQHPPDAAALHAGRGDDAHRDAHRAAAGPLRPRRPPRLLRRSRSWKRSSRGPPASSMCGSMRKGRGDRPPSRGHAAHRQPAAAACGTSPRCAVMVPSTQRRAARPRRLRRRRPRTGQGGPAFLGALCRAVRGGPVGLSTLPSPSASSPRRWRTSTSRSSSNRDCSYARREAAYRCLRPAHLGADASARSPGDGAAGPVRVTLRGCAVTSCR